ncbi:disease resistance protein [Striga asiatica]|uniref:Disease resistance protein n=1 Tax=Striga asiatica TaxID=4170 RepID=A0A5A7Q8F3_STRAF|nr:disease resistance protein [Striga asiatica]
MDELGPDKREVGEGRSGGSPPEAAAVVARRQTAMNQKFGLRNGFGYKYTCNEAFCGHTIQENIFTFPLPKDKSVREGFANKWNSSAEELFCVIIQGFVQTKGMTKESDILDAFENIRQACLT